MLVQRIPSLPLEGRDLDHFTFRKKRDSDQSVDLVYAFRLCRFRQSLNCSRVEVGTPDLIRGNR